MPRPHSESLLGLTLSHSQLTQTLTRSQGHSSWIGFGSWSACYLSTLPSISRSKTQGRRPQALSLWSPTQGQDSLLSPFLFLSSSLYLFFVWSKISSVGLVISGFEDWKMGFLFFIFYFNLGVAMEIWKEGIFGIGCWPWVWCWVWGLFQKSFLSAWA